MTQVYNITELPTSKKGSHLSCKEMCKIEAWHKDGHSNLKIAAKTEEAVDKALSEMFAVDNELKHKVFKSCTADNGSEFAGIRELAEGLKVYFCHPYASYERGSSENQHKLIRRFIPKGTPLEKVSDIQIKRITQRINDYPRRILGYDTAYNVFIQEIKKLEPFALPA